MNSIDSIFDYFEKQGHVAYFGEPVSQTAHALQAASFAEEDGAPNTLVVAALLHDVGHLLHNQGEDAAGRGIDARHELAAQGLLEQSFGPAVAQPVALHVAAKRYLCFADAAYLAQLSPASVQSLQLQGGPMSPDEAAAFEDNEYYREAVQLRRWDDRAKVPGMHTKPLAYYRPALERALLDHAHAQA